MRTFPELSAQTRRQLCEAAPYKNFVPVLGAGLMLMATAAGNLAQAQTFTGFGQTFPSYDNGFNPSVAIGGPGLGVTEVHNATSSASALWYRRGTIVGGSAPSVAWQNSQPYDVGFNPSIAAFNEAVVEVHNAGNGPGPLMYRVGTLNKDGQTIDWMGESRQYDSYGLKPQIAMTYGITVGMVVVEVHNGGTGVGPLWYRTGTLNLDGSITWFDSHQFDSYSTNPSVAVFASGKVVEVHNDNDVPGGPLWYRYGTLGVGNSTITFGSPGIYGSGWNPKIATYGYEGPNGNGIEVHGQSSVFGPLDYVISGLPGGAVVSYDNGNNASVAAQWSECSTSDGLPVTAPAPQLYTVEVHNDGPGPGPMSYRVGQWSCSTIFNGIFLPR
jgi:hypothetical protein